MAPEASDTAKTALHEVALERSKREAHEKYCEQREEHWKTTSAAFLKLIDKLDAKVDRVETETREKFKSVYGRFDRQQWWLIAILVAAVAALFKDKIGL